MKNNIVILFILFSLFSFSQEEKENYSEVALKFKSFYNESNYQAIFNMFDDSMKKALPLPSATDFFKQSLNEPAGKIMSMEFYKTKQSAHIYKTTFERALLDVLISLDQSDQINGLYVSQHVPDDQVKLERNSTKMILPFNEKWFVFWGGTTVKQNYHVAYNNQKYAYDLLILENGKSYHDDPKENKNYFVFGKEIISPCDAKVVTILTGVQDNIPGEMNPTQLTGNTIVLKTINNEYILFAHLKEGSVVVSEGQEIKQGELLGLCGNSGNSSEPHLHLSLQNVKNMNESTGAQLFFEKINVNGEIKEDYLPVKNDKIQNIKK